MATKQTRTKPRSSATGAVQTPAANDQAPRDPGLLWAESLERLLCRMESSDEGRGWLRLWELLRLAQKDPVISASVSASHSLELVITILGDATDETSARWAWNNLYRLMCVRGGGRPVQLDPKKAKRLRGAGLTYREIAAELGCSERHVRTLVKR